MGEIVTDETFLHMEIPARYTPRLAHQSTGLRCTVLGRWSQPAGLLRIATLLKQRGYAIDFVDCMETDARGMVTKAIRTMPRETAHRQAR